MFGLVRTAAIMGWRPNLGLPGRQGSPDRKQHCPTPLKEETGSDRETGRTPASHTGNWLSAWGMTQRETGFFIPQTPFLFSFLSSSPLRGLLITTAAALHPVSIHTQPSKPISGLTVYNCVCVRVPVCVRMCCAYVLQRD